MPELRIGLTEKQTALDKLIPKHENCFYGGSKGGGKSVGMRYLWLKYCLEIPNLHAVIFRKTYPELYGNHISRMHEDFPELRGYYNSSHKEFRLPNGSVLAFRHNQYDRDLGDHQGVEYQYLGIEEAGEWPENWFWYLKGCNRSSNPNIKARCLLTGNPGGIGHKWLKRLFIDRQFRPGIEKPDDFAFIPASVWDNPMLMKNDPNYIDRLRANKNPMLVKAYLEGSWDIMAGQYFDMVSRETHMVDPFEIPDYWERTFGFDTGYNHPAAFVWMATDTDGNTYIYREYCQSKKRTEEVVHDLMQYPDTLKWGHAIEAGWDCWSKHGGGPSVEEKFSEASEHKLVLHKANIDRIPGAQQLRDYLVVRENGPRLKILKNCPMTFDALTRMTHDPNRPEDVLKVDAVDGDPMSGDDLYDAVRMALMGRPKISVEPPKPRRKDYFRDKPSPVSWTTV